MFYDRYIELCERAGERPYSVAKKLGLGNSNVAQWKKGSTPRPEVLAKVADYFGVTVEYLLTGEGQKEKPYAKNGEELLDNYLIKKFLMLTPDEMEKVDAFVQGLLAARQA